MRTLAFGATAGCIVFVCGKHPIDDGEWDDYLIFIQDVFVPDQPVPFLVESGGAGPTAVQRQKLNDVLAPVVKRMTCAVMTGSQIARGIVTVMAWIYPVYRAFSPAQLDEAIRFLGIAEPSVPKVKQLLAELKEELVKP